MPFYWSLESVPELAGLSKERRKEISRKIRWKSAGPWYWAVTFPTWIGVLLLTESTIARYRNPFFVGTAINVLLAWCFGITGIHFKIARLLPEIRRMAGGLCTNCGYDLRTSPDRCPECGTICTTGVSPAQREH